MLSLGRAGLCRAPCPPLSRALSAAARLGKRPTLVPQRPPSTLLPPHHRLRGWAITCSARFQIPACSESSPIRWPLTPGCTRLPPSPICRARVAASLASAEVPSPHHCTHSAR
eukprot:7352246-Prymnesium_polylepis.1